MNLLTGKDALRRCIEILGTQQAVADAVGRRQQAVCEILHRGKRVPAEWCRPLEAATAAKGCCVRAADLRPDLFGPVVVSNTEVAA